MKKIFAGLLIVAALVTNQLKAQHNFSVRVFGAPQFGFLQNKDDMKKAGFDSKARFNTAFGVGCAYSFTKKAALGLDVLYSLQGQRFDINGKDSVQKQNYFKIPVYFEFMADASGPVCFVGKIGPQLSILASSKREPDKGSFSTNTRDWYKSVTVGGMAGAGAQFRLRRKLFLTTMGRFDYDFTNAEDRGHKYWRGDRNNTYNMTAGLEIGLRYQLN
jgi:hypothetical protein